MVSQPSTRVLVAGLACSLALATALVYAPVLGHDFVHYDDPVNVTGSPNVQRGLTRESVSWALTANHSRNWYPLTLLSHMLDVELYGLEPAGHHATSVALHCLNVVLFFLLLQRATGASWRSALAAALFGLHPLRVESVAWVAERKDVLSAAFGLAGLVGILLMLAASGIYAIMSFSVAARTREIGIRAAMGAQRAHIAYSVLRRALIQLGLGVLLGMPVAGVIFQSRDDATTLSAFLVAFVPGVAIMIVIGLLACGAPTMSALRITPTEALRER